jgi:hypothetical protein
MNRQKSGCGIFLSDSELLKMTPPQMDNYIGRVQSKGEISSDDLRKLKEQRRKVINRVYARNSRYRKKKEVLDLIEINNDLTDDRDRWRLLALENEKEIKRLKGVLPHLYNSPPISSPSPTMSDYSSDSNMDLFELF